MPRKPAKKDTADADAIKRLQAVPMTAEPDDDLSLDDGLTMRQRLFVQAITGPHLGNGTAAARAAGYRETSARAIATENLTKPAIQAAIRQALAKKLGGPEWAEHELISLASADFSNFAHIQEDGRLRIDWQKAAAYGALGAVKEISFDPETGEPKFKLHDRAAILRTLLQLYGRIVERHEHSGPDGGPVQVQAARAAERMLSDPQAFELAQQLNKRLAENNGGENAV